MAASGRADGLETEETKPRKGLRSKTSNIGDGLAQLGSLSLPFIVFIGFYPFSCSPGIQKDVCQTGVVHSLQTTAFFGVPFSSFLARHFMDLSISRRAAVRTALTQCQVSPCFYHDVERRQMTKE